MARQSERSKLLDARAWRTLAEEREEWNKRVHNSGTTPMRWMETVPGVEWSLDMEGMPQVNVRKTEGTLFTGMIDGKVIAVSKVLETVFSAMRTQLARLTAARLYSLHTGTEEMRHRLLQTIRTGNDNES